MALTADEQAELEWCRKMVGALRETMLGQAEDGAISIAVNGRSITHMTTDDLRRNLEIYQRKVEKLARKELGIKRGRTVRVYG